MFDIFGNEALEKAGKELQKSFNDMVEFHERLRLFLLDLKELNNPDVDRLFNEHGVEIRVVKSEDVLKGDEDGLHS